MKLCKKHQVPLTEAYNYFPKKKKHWVCPKCLKEMMANYKKEVS